MATTRLMPLHNRKDRTTKNSISNIIDYVENPGKTDNGRLITCWQCEGRVADAEFLYTKEEYRRLNDTICIQNGYSIVANPKRHGKA